MPKVRIQFRTSNSRTSYWSDDLRISDGETATIDRERAQRLMKAFPGNFKILGPIPEPYSPIPPKRGKPVHKPLKLSEITIVTLHHWTEEILKQDLLSYLPPEIEYIQFDNRGNRLFSSAAQGLNHAIRKAGNDIVMCVHEDIIFKKKWFENFVQQESRLSNWGAIGIVGVGLTSLGHHWGFQHQAPCLAQTLDDCCIIINKKNNIWFDEKTFTDWHCYGVDFCLQARHKGLNVYIMNGPGFHDDKPKSYGLAENFLQNLARYKKILREKWGNKFPKIMTTTGAC